MARGGYTGIHEVYETPYGGFLSCFGQGSDEGPPNPEEIAKNLGTNWELEQIRVKLHASMAALHGTIDCIANLQKAHPDKMKDLDHIIGIEVECSKAAYEHGGWIAMDDKQLTTTSAQMSIQYAASAQLVDGVVLMAQFSEEKLNRPILRALMRKVHPRHNPEFDTTINMTWHTRMTVFGDKGFRRIRIILYFGNTISI
jgi:aconitate decarboxylase